MAATNYKGFDLFDDIEDATLRTRNRAVVLTNIAEDHTKERRINAKGAALILGYFGSIPDNERGVVRDVFKSTMKDRGYELVAG